MNIRLLSILVFTTFFFLRETSSQCPIKYRPFKPGETVNFQAYYNWGFIWVFAGEVQFRTFEKTYHNEPVYEFEATGNSLKNYDWLYKVRDKYQSFADKETLLPMYFERNTSEGGYKAFEQYFFNYAQNNVFGTVENNDLPRTKDTIKLSSCTFDVLSAIYFCRSMDFDNFKINERQPITTLIDNKVYSLYFKYLGKETIENKDKKKYRCFKFSALMIEGTIFKGGEDIVVWVTDDDNRIPILVEAKILIGSVKAYFTNATGLKYPVTSLLN
jgi:hypothetical protein